MFPLSAPLIRVSSATKICLALAIMVCVSFRYVVDMRLRKVRLFSDGGAHFGVKVVLDQQTIKRWRGNLSLMGVGQSFSLDWVEMRRRPKKGRHHTVLRSAVCDGGYALACSLSSSAIVRNQVS